jgi:hypothetical protein
MAKCAAEVVTPDLFDGHLSVPVVVRAADVRRRDYRSVPVAVVAELCEWCGVDRAGGCGACSDLKHSTR